MNTPRAKTTPSNARRVRLLLLTLLTFLVGSLLLSPERVHADVPAPQNPPSPNGIFYAFDLLVGTWYYYPTNGLIFQPDDFTAVINPNTIETIVYVPITVTNEWGFSGLGAKKLNLISYSNYYRVGWKAYDTVNITIPDTSPTTTILVPIKMLSTLGPHYFQFRLRYANASPEFVYSSVFNITGVRAPVAASSLKIVPDETRPLWGQTVELKALTEPEENTSVITWRPIAPDTLGTLTRTTSETNEVALARLSDPNDARLQHDDGLELPLSATAENADSSGVPVRGETVLKVGGASPLFVEQGDTVSFKPPALDNADYPGTPTFSWRLLDENKKPYTLKPEERAVLNQDTLVYENVSGPPSGKMHYQLQISFKSSNASTYWLTNIAPLTIKSKASTKLTAIPQLSFALKNGEAPRLDALYQKDALTLNYQGQEGALSISTSTPWSLSATLSPFVERENQRRFSAPNEPVVMHLLLQNGAEATLKDDNRPTTVIAAGDSSLTTAISTQTTLVLPHPKTPLTGKFEAAITWSLTRAP